MCCCALDRIPAKCDIHQKFQGRQNKRRKAMMAEIAAACEEHGFTERDLVLCQYGNDWERRTGRTLPTLKAMPYHSVLSLHRDYLQKVIAARSSPSAPGAESEEKT